MRLMLLFMLLLSVLSFPMRTRSSRVGTGQAQTVTKSQTTSCFENPSQPRCADSAGYYTAAMIQEDLANLCTVMPGMSGCVVRAECGGGHIKGGKCSGWSQLAEICTKMMSGMEGCKHYADLCLKNNRTVVKMCQHADPVVGLVDEMTAKANTKKLCTQMSMEGCRDCTDSSCPAPLLTYSKLCNSMPHMTVCKAWSSMCAANPNELGILCTDSPTTSGQSCSQAAMNMLFHFNENDPILFDGVYVCSTPFYVLVCICCAFSGGFYSFLKRIKTRYTGVLIMRKELKIVDDAASFILSFILVTMSYLIMLIAMTYNVGYFLSCMVGLAIGQYVLIERPAILKRQAANDDSSSLKPLMSGRGNSNSRVSHPINSVDDDENDYYNCCE